MGTRWSIGGGTCRSGACAGAGGAELEPHLRVWKDSATQIRFDAPIPVEVEARPAVAQERYPTLARQVEDAVRSRLQVRVAVAVVPPGTIPRAAYKTALVQVRSSP